MGRDSIYMGISEVIALYEYIKNTKEVTADER